MIFTLFLISIVGGFFSGLLGIGGAVVLIPLMLMVPPLVGVGRLTMGQVAGISMIQVLAASISGCLTHRRSGFADMRVILAIGIPMGVFALIGAVFSKAMSDEAIKFVFGCLVAAALIMLFRKTSEESGNMADDRDFKMAHAVLIGCFVGIVSGIVGAGGGFILVPLMIRVLKIPMRVAVGSTLGIVFLGALMGSAGKILTFQVEFIYLLPVIAGSVPAAIAGSKASRKMPVAYIRYLLLVVIGFTFLSLFF